MVSANAATGGPDSSDVESEDDEKTMNYAYKKYSQELSKQLTKNGAAEVDAQQPQCRVCKKTSNRSYRNWNSLYQHAANTTAIRPIQHRGYARALAEYAPVVKIAAGPSVQHNGLKRDIDDKIIWPPVIVLENAWSVDPKIQAKNVGLTTAQLRDLFKTSSPSAKVKALYRTDKHVGVGLLVFPGSRDGYVEATLMADKFLRNGRGREAWNRERQIRDGVYKGLKGASGTVILYGYLANLDDMERLDKSKHNVKWRIMTYSEAVEAPAKKKAQVVVQQEKVEKADEPPPMAEVEAVVDEAARAEQEAKEAERRAKEEVLRRRMEELAKLEKEINRLDGEMEALDQRFFENMRTRDAQHEEEVAEFEREEAAFDDERGDSSVEEGITDKREKALAKEAKLREQIKSVSDYVEPESVPMMEAMLQHVTGVATLVSRDHDEILKVKAELYTMELDLKRKHLEERRKLAGVAAAKRNEVLLRSAEAREAAVDKLFAEIERLETSGKANGKDEAAPIPTAPATVDVEMVEAVADAELVQP
eukprot:TRINITY_DN264_c2_g1_i1.p1 TRINITY_DN264_c2_g1~~TRINITY_DN264_c2_g1_i1.p1  ORF type:complete len:546 (+),score=149.50 TRINITY_DN264_c2_g1_i1:36-1640(+)